ncbi:MAG: zinc ribbon domain-containing protein [Candidatus Thorarchaeota archaeon]
MRKSKETNDEAWPLLIPIGVLIIVMLGTGVIWILIPIFVLVCVFFGNLSEQRKISERRAEYVPIRTYDESSGDDASFKSEKPLYDREKQKDEGIAFGTLIPVLILFWLFVQSLSWIFLIPVFFLLWSFFESVIKNIRGKPEVREEIERGDARSIQEIADRTGLPEGQVRRQIVREKRSGSTDIWFDPSTGERAPASQHNYPHEGSKVGCVYCGFSLRSEDRFCPYCGAPIKV